MNKSLENKLRRRLAKDGLLLKKSRKSTSLDNFGEYMIVDSKDNAIIAGNRFDLSLEDVENWIVNWNNS